MKKIFSIVLVIVMAFSTLTLFVGCEKEITRPEMPDWEVAIKNPETGEYVSGDPDEGITMRIRYTGEDIYFYPIFRDKKTKTHIKGISPESFGRSVIKDEQLTGNEHEPCDRGYYRMRFYSTFSIPVYDGEKYEVFRVSHLYYINLFLYVI